MAPQQFWRGDHIRYSRMDDQGLQVVDGIVNGQALPEPASQSSRCVFARFGVRWAVRCSCGVDVYYAFGRYGWLRGALRGQCGVWGTRWMFFIRVAIALALASIDRASKAV